MPHDMDVDLSKLGLAEAAQPLKCRWGDTSIANCITAILIFVAPAQKRFETGPSGRLVATAFGHLSSFFVTRDYGRSAS